MEIKTARLTLLIDPNKKAAFERLCAERDITASQVVRQMIRDYLAQHGVSYEPSGVGEDEPEARPGPAPSSAAPRKVARKPKAAEVEVLRGLLERHQSTYAADPVAAQTLLKTGLAPAPGDLNASELAAWTGVTRAILNLHEVITRN